ncbi:MAG: zeta toxin family protein [Hyphomonadaceae bacterium]|nr:zeta toxin family protein [Hyphomonadaceae bacterium]
MREIIIIAGPNGAGKTSFANEYLPAEHEALLFINADEIARDLASTGLSGAALDLRAGRVMLAQIDDAIRQGREIMFETTLTTIGYAQKIPRWQQEGYHVSLIYLRLPSVEDSIARVRRRVQAGGHDVPEETILRRFSKSLEYLEARYKPIVDEWYIWNSLEGDFQLVEAWDDEQAT